MVEPREYPIIKTEGDFSKESHHEKGVSFPSFPYRVDLLLYQGDRSQGSGEHPGDYLG